jgi:hypothetical protein
VNVRKLALNDDSDNFSDSFLEWRCYQSQRYYQGDLLVKEFNDLLARDGWTIVEFQTLLLRYLSIIRNIALKRGREIEVDRIDSAAPGWLLDATPQNIMIKQDGSAYFIDQEWIARTDISIGFLVFRAIYLSVNSSRVFGKSTSQAITNVASLFRATVEVLGWQVSDDHLLAFARLEHKFESTVFNLAPSESSVTHSVFSYDFSESRNIWQTQQDKLKWYEETMAWQQDKLKWCEETMAWQAKRIEQLDGPDEFGHHSR